MIRLLLVDDQTIVRQGLRSLLESKPDFQVVGEAENGQAAIALLETLYETPLQPNVILMDVRMPIMDGVATTQEICQQFPAVKILVLTTFDDDEYVSQAMRLGAKGYLLKDTPLETLSNAIRSVDKGHTQLGPGLFEKIMAHPQASITGPVTPLPPGLAKLTPREREVLRLIALGASNREIAQSLFITERTVKNHVTSILNRLNLRDVLRQAASRLRTQAALLASSYLHLFE